MVCLGLHNNWQLGNFLEPQVQNWGGDLTKAKLPKLLQSTNLKIDAGTRGHGEAETEKFSSFVVNESSGVADLVKANNKLSASRQNCPADLKTLVSLLIRDLPSYANREIQKARRLDRTVDQFSYVIVAGNPEFEPLPLSPSQGPSTPSAVEGEETQQVFFTTLERRYREGKALESQNFYRIFLTQTTEGWRLVMMFSQLGSTSGQRPPTPPRESSNSAIGQAIKTWLRDCRAGAIHP